MLKTVKAIYEQGQLRLLEDASLTEGEKVIVTIESTTNDYTPNLQQIASQPIDENERQKIYAWLDSRTAGTKPLSTLIIEERGD